MSLGTFRPKSSTCMLEMGEVGEVEEEGHFTGADLESPLLKV